MTDKAKRILLPRQHNLNFCQRNRNWAMQICLKPDPQNPITTWHQLTPLSSQKELQLLCYLLCTSKYKCQMSYYLMTVGL